MGRGPNGWIVFRGKVVEGGPTEKVTFEQRGKAVWVSGKRAFQVKGTASAKLLRRKCEH